MSEAADDRESEIPMDNGKVERSGSSCSGEDNRNVSHNLTINDIW